jgi:hypothetical protein
MAITLFGPWLRAAVAVVVDLRIALRILGGTGHIRADFSEPLFPGQCAALKPTNGTEFPLSFPDSEANPKERTKCEELNSDE